MANRQQIIIICDIIICRNVSMLTPPTTFAVLCVCVCVCVFFLNNTLHAFLLSNFDHHNFVVFSAAKAVPT